jgi:hypothetical protein
MTSRNPSNLRRRLPRRGDDSGSLLLAMLLLLVGSALASLMVPMFLTELHSTTNDGRRVHQLDAAEAGIDVAIGQIRASNDGAGNGELSGLPCGTYTGAVGVGNSSRYQVTISYYPSDPKGQTAAWLSANAIQCIAGTGARSTPSYALLQSLGTDTATGSFSTVSIRSLQATYIFQTTNQNIAGGLIHVYLTSTSTDLCIDAGSDSPAAGANATMQKCTPGSSQQKFAYNDNLTISLVSTQTTSQPQGMCLDAGSPEATNAVLHFEPCGTVTEPQQQWSLNDSANFVGTSDGINLNSFCFNVQTQNFPGSLIILSTNCNGGYDNIQTFSPDAAVGAGAAGASSGQLVNFSEFGRCLDVTNYDVTYAYMIAWPCKQAPNPSSVGWNERWALPSIAASATSSAPGAITTNSGSQLYCLQSPGVVGTGNYVTVNPCSATGVTPLNMQWTVYGATTDYTSSYRIIDAYGNCLQPTDPSAIPTDFFPSGNNISKIAVAVCSGSTLQKWNAPPNVQQPLPLKDIGEK